MQQQVGIVVAGGVGLKKLIVQGVRQPGEGMPVARLAGSERPLQRVPVQAGLDLFILGYINIVIVIDERVTANRVVQRNRRNHEQNSQGPGVLLDPMTSSRAEVGWRCRLRCQANGTHYFSLFSQITRQFSARRAYCPRWICCTSWRHSRSWAVSPSA